jgi:Electron transfer DM13
MASTAPRLAPLSVPLRLLVVPVVAAILLGGLYVFAGLVAPGYYTSIGFGAGWMLVAGVTMNQLAKRVPGLRWYVRGTVIATSLAVGAWFALTSLGDTTVNEKVVTGVRASDLPAGQPSAEPATREAAARPVNVELASAPIRPASEGSASGEARVIQLARGGRRLTLTDLSVSNGPDLRVYLAAGRPTSDGEVDRYRDLGALKGNKGTQQYRIPSNVNIRRYSTVYVWCRAFTVSFARAALRPS